MPYFVLNGKPDCPNFVHALHVAQYLSDHLPQFLYKKIEKVDKEWADYVNALNKDNKWFVTSSPLIWREINMWGGKKYLIGGLSEFWEYIYCYYGLESVIPKEELINLAKDNYKFFLENQETSTLVKDNIRIISIFGATSYQTLFLMIDLLEIEALNKQKGMDFKLYDEQGNNSYKYEIMVDYAEYINSQRVFGARDIVTICDNEEKAIQDTDILIYIEDCTKQDTESRNDWLNRCYTKMVLLADQINHYAKRTLTVILNNPGPICFMASVLVEFCTKIRLSNIVAVTADEGLSYISSVSKHTGIPLNTMSAPPVWGFIGLNSFINIRNIVFKAEMCRPYARALTAPIGSTLPLGTIRSEVRLMSHMIADRELIINETEIKRQKMERRLQRPAILRKLRALTSLLRLWYAPERSDHIISLGICSNGSFGIPIGVVFSQPTILNDRGKWMPYAKFPLMNEYITENVNKCISDMSGVLEKFNLQRAPCQSEKIIIESDLTDCTL